jgi:hypothetical protein
MPSRSATENIDLEKPWYSETLTRRDSSGPMLKGAAAAQGRRIDLSSHTVEQNICINGAR